MNVLLIFFAIPIAVIVISIALQKILKCPILVAAIIFSILLIVTFVINSLEFLVAVIIYTILSFITALLVCVICQFKRRFCENLDMGSRQNNQNDRNQSDCNCDNNNDNNNDNDNGNHNNCPGSTREGNNIDFRACITPTSRNSGRVCGCYRRR